jgi:hypothetical protein
MFTPSQAVSYESKQLSYYEALRSLAYARFIQRYELWSASFHVLHVCRSRKQGCERISNEAWNVFNDTSAYSLCYYSEFHVEITKQSATLQLKIFAKYRSRILTFSL